nr:bulb-type lectin domain-containing protein [Tanacetum cinerariifolium]
MTYDRNRCGIRYMIDNEEGMVDTQQDSVMTCEDSMSMVESHNKFLEEYFESIDPIVECSLIKGMEDFKMEKEDIDKLVYKNWEVLGKKFMKMLDWFYLGYLGQDVLGELPPVIGVIKVDLLGLYKFANDLGGYMSVSLNKKWNEIAKLLGLAQENQEAVKECYKDGTAWKREPQAFAGMRSVEIVDTSEDGTPKGTGQVDVKDESNSVWTTNNNGEAYTSSSDDFIVIT